MPTIKVPADKSGKLSKKETVNDPTKIDWIEKCEKTEEISLKGKLVKPKDATIKGSLTFNKVTKNLTMSTGKAVTVGPFPMNTNCDNFLEFKGQTDKPGEDHEIEVDKA